MEWRNINDSYLISENGICWSKKSNRVLKGYISCYGYRIYALSNGRTHKKIFAHRAVAFAFIPLIENKNHVNHIDGDKLNNCVSNLEWVDIDDNNKHAAKFGLFPKGLRNRRGKLSSISVQVIREAVCIGLKYKDISRYFNINRATVSRINTLTRRKNG